MALLETDELSVNELQEITRLGQSRISTHLGLLQDCGLLQSRREGKRTFYKLGTPENGGGEIVKLAIRGAGELPEHEGDQVNLKRILQRRGEQAQTYFNQVAGRFDRIYGPGRSWQAFGHFLLRVLPPLDVADLGAGEGLLSELLARRCRKVIAVDNSEKMVTFGAAKAKKNHLKNLEFRLGDLQDPPIESESVDLVILSQALHHAEDPGRAIEGATAFYDPAGRLWFWIWPSTILAGRMNFTGIGGWDLRRAICTCGWRRPVSNGWKSASWPGRSSHPISKPSWPGPTRKRWSSRRLRPPEVPGGSRLARGRGCRGERTANGRQ